jgi:hypothetical protein
MNPPAARPAPVAPPMPFTRAPGTIQLARSPVTGVYTLGPPHPGSAFGVYWPALLDQDVLEHVHHHDDTTETIAPGTPDGAEGETGPLTESARQPQPPPWTADELVVASLGEMVHARSGDNGGDANLGVWVRDLQVWEWLKSTLIIAELRRILPEARDLESRGTSSRTSARSTSSCADCSGPAPPRRCGSTHRRKRSANGCAHAAPKCRAP